MNITEFFQLKRRHSCSMVFKRDGDFRGNVEPGNKEPVMLMQLESKSAKMLPPQAEKKMRCWVRSRHLICSGHFFIFETVEYTTIERFAECVASLGGSLISVEPINKIWMGANRQVILYQAKASLHTPHHTLKQYWIKYGGFYTRFDERC